MEFKRFSLGLRFAMTKDAALSIQDVWDIVFSHVPAALVQGLLLYGAWDNTAIHEPEPAYICIFSKLSMKRAKRLYHALVADGLLCSHLTAYMPFVQNNWVEKCAEVEYLGCIGPDGTVAEGNARYAGRIFSSLPPAGEAKPPRVIIAAESLGNAYTPADVARRMIRAAARAYPAALITPARISDGGCGTVDTMVAACCGRYLLCAETGVRYGVLPDRTVVLETEQLTDEQFLQTLERIMRDGFRMFLLAAGKRRMQNMDFPPDISVTILSNPVPAAPYSNARVSYASGVDTILNCGGFLRLCEGAAAVVLATAARDESCELLGATADTIRFHCDQHRVPFSIIARRDASTYIIRPHGRPAESVFADDLDTAARTLFQRLGPLDN